MRLVVEFGEVQAAERVYQNVVDELNRLMNKLRGEIEQLTSSAYVGESSSKFQSLGQMVDQAQSILNNDGHLGVQMALAATRSRMAQAEADNVTALSRVQSNFA
ncbi:hypothetical protein [Plantactinospora sp. B5E13]|uniref:hypothetical protein n=1 Tax=unclassified Plantactinospora TaxID=2631981 RepID=UPI00325C7A96